MQKILVEIFIPATRTSLDLYIPNKTPLHSLLELIAKPITELTEGRFFPATDSIFCDKATGIPLDINMNAQELCLHDGSCLMLI